MDANPLAKMMNPRSIAVYGASESGESVGSLVFANLLADGFTGQIYPINPKHKKVGGLTCYPSILDVRTPSSCRQGSAKAAATASTRKKS